MALCCMCSLLQLYFWEFATKHKLCPLWFVYTSGVSNFLSHFMAPYLLCYYNCVSYQNDKWALFVSTYLRRKANPRLTYLATDTTVAARLTRMISCLVGQMFYNDILKLHTWDGQFSIFLVRANLACIYSYCSFSTFNLLVKKRKAVQKFAF